MIGQLMQGAINRYRTTAAVALLLTIAGVFSLLSIPALWAGRARGPDPAVAVVTSAFVLLGSAALIAFGNPFITQLVTQFLQTRIRSLIFQVIEIFLERNVRAQRR